MPTIHRRSGFRFFFYSHESNEPPHVHIEKGDAAAKVWLSNEELAYTHGFTPVELRFIQQEIGQHRTDFIQRYNEHLDR